MIRNLIQKLPNIKCTSEYAFKTTTGCRYFRSLSPVERLRSTEGSARSISCSRTEDKKSYLLADRPEKLQTRTFSFSKEYYANNDVKTRREDEVQWRETPPKEPVNEATSTEPLETLEQYELEAARPRPSKSQNLIEAFTIKMHSVDPHCHLQPNQMKPYGASDNFYSNLLIRPTNSLKYPRKFKKYATKDMEIDINNNVKKADSKSSLNGFKRSFSTTTCSKNKHTRNLSTTKSCIGKQEHGTTNNNKSKSNSKFSSTSKLPSFTQLPKANFYSEYLLDKNQKLDFLPPKYQSSLMDRNEDTDIMEISSPEMRRLRKEEQNRKGSIKFKLSYSDLIKQKIKERQDDKLLIKTDIAFKDNKITGGSILNSRNKMLDAFKNLPGKRSMATRSKSNLSTKNVTTNQTREARNFSSKKSKKSKAKNEKIYNKQFNPECEDICTNVVRLVEDAKIKSYPYEPKKCEPEQPAIKKVFLKSKIKLAPPPACTERPPYRECEKVDICDIERADDCIDIKYKPLPKLEPGPCPCIDPQQPNYAPKLEKLHFKFEDPPKVVCHEPPCQIPRADDSNPHKFKPLKPYKPKECSCIEPPPMFDVKLKRLPKCEPEEVCRPKRVCPVVHKCPPRADESYKVVPKKLPFIQGAPCPCVEPPAPTIAPPIKRLDLSVPEPERVCIRKVVCSSNARADDNLAIKKKKLPKFVPGDCPCEDRPMVDWNLKRLVCEEHVEDCVVPDPCKTYPRADWGCWEYEEEECAEVDEKCIDKRVKCPPKHEKKGHPCDSKIICGTWPTVEMNKRKFSNSSINSSLRLFRTQINDTNDNKEKSAKSHSHEDKLLDKNCKESRKLKGKKSKMYPTLSLIEGLNKLEQPKNIADPLLFKPKKRDKVDYDNILKAIASTTVKLDKKEPKNCTILSAQTLRKPKTNGITTVSSRAISTGIESNNMGSEIDIKKKKDCEAKEKCKKIKPTIKSLMMCHKPCPRYNVCPDKSREHRPACKVDRVPVCCEKEDAPYTAYTDNLEETYRPFTTKTPQFNCSSPKYGFYPNLKKEYDPLDNDKNNKTDKKNFSTNSTSNTGKGFPIKNSLANSRTLNLNISNPSQQALRLASGKVFKSAAPSKGLLSKNNTIHNTFLTQSRSLTTKVFHIHMPVCPKKVKPSTECGNVFRDKGKAKKIVCYEKSDCKNDDKRDCCYRDYDAGPRKRRPPPFPAFSDCLDEEMEEILTECPLDREKYLRMQPRFMNPPPKPIILKPPPPIQGKIDILKEQQCIREKLCIENEGVTQSCTDFGKRLPLLKSKKIFTEVNWDCKRMEELKKMGRWPPFTLKSSRRFSTDAEFRNFSPNCLQRRTFHALTNRVNKTEPYAANNNNNIKEEKLNKEKSYNNNKNYENMKLVENMKLYQQNMRKENDNNVARRVQRYYTTYKINKKGFGFKRPYLKSPIMKLHRGMRNYKTSKGGCKIKTGQKKDCPKFTLNNCPPRAHRNKHFEKIARDCAKPNTPYPAYSECKNHPLVSECAYDVEKIDDLQPNLSLINGQENIKDFPTQDRINRAIGVEYYKCKHGVANEGTTIGCDSLGEFICKKSRKRQEDNKKSEIVEFLVQDHQTTVCSQSPNDEDPCDKDRKKLEDMCMKECIKQIPCHLPEEEKYCICKERCGAYFRQKDSNPSCPEEDIIGKCERIEKINCEDEQKVKLEHVECIKPPPPPEAKACKDMVPKQAPCPRKPTQLEAIWQKIVNYFKARPNCPAPGDYKKKAIREKAEKAASALGLVIVDPKCLPPEMLKGLKGSKKDCKACPNKRPASPETQKRSFSTHTFQQSRRYSKNCKNLEEINRMLEENEIKKRVPNFKKGIGIFLDRKDALAAEALRMSLDLEIYNYTDYSVWCNKENKCPKSYFGYFDVIPSRENVLERAWRISIEAYNKCNCPKTFNLFNEFFTRVENSIKSYEDLEKLKTEDILRELDEFLKSEDSSKKKK